MNRIFQKGGNAVKIDIDNDVKYAGSTRTEQKLNKELFRALLELNYYEDTYDNMMSVDDIKYQLDRMNNLLNKKSISLDTKKALSASIDTLTWVLNGSKTRDEKLASLPRASKEEVKNIIERINQDYHQISMYELGVKDENESN